MTKEELERIKQAYYSGLKVQIWFNGHWENFDTRDYSMYSDPFSENRHYRIVGSAYADIAEKRIAELEAYNEKLLDGDIEKHNKIVELQAQIEKMKLYQNCRFESYDDMEEPCRNCSRLLGDIKRKDTSDKWEM